MATRMPSREKSRAREALSPEPAPTISAISGRGVGIELCPVSVYCRHVGAGVACSRQHALRRRTGRHVLFPQRFAIYIVISIPKRKSIARGVSHFIRASDVYCIVVKAWSRDAQDFAPCLRQDLYLRLTVCAQSPVRQP